MLSLVRKDAIDDEKARLAALLIKIEGKVSKAFQAFIADATSEPVVRAVLAMVEQGQIDAALAVIDQHIATLATAITSAFGDAATAEAVSILGQVVATTASPVSIAFDPTNPRAAAIMRNERLGFIREFTDEQRTVTREAIASGLQQGNGPRQIATDFRASIGLTQRQSAAVDSYRRLLTRGSAQALDRQLRDRRYDRSVQRAVDGTKPLTPDQIETQVERYRQRMLAYRAENIARTEGGRALSLGREEAMQQSIDAGSVQRELVDQVWNTIVDGRERLSHEAMNQQVQPWSKPFVSGAGYPLRYPHDPNAPADEVVGCRCSVIYRIRRAFRAEAA